jgi:pimeloyl-ACP methyl ester carboxylesterase
VPQPAGNPVADSGPDSDELDLVAQEAAELGIAAMPALHRVEGRLSALRWGSGPLAAVWLHGAGLNAHTFDGTILIAGLPSLAIDLPGHGSSPWRADADYSPSTNADPVAETIAAQGLSRGGAVVVGHSLGGLTAIALASRHPELTAGLVIIDVSPGLRSENAQPVTDFLAGATDFASREEIVDRAVRFGFGGSPTALRRAVVLNTRVREDGRVIFRHHLAQLAADQLPSDFRALWPMAEALRLPVLLVRATQGFLTDALEAEFISRVPSSSVVRIDAGHNIQEQAPVELAAAVSNFVAEVAGR